MLVSWRYRERSSPLQRLDPRTYWIFYACFFMSVLQYWDLRILLVFLVIALAVLLLSRVTWRESRRAFLFISAFIVFYSLISFLTGKGGIEVYTVEHVIKQLAAPFRIFGWTPTLTISVERIFYGLSMLVRVFSISTATILIPYVLNPAQYGVAFHGMGLPDKFAYAMDLTMRFIPTYGRDFQLTLDAQRARGLELDNVRGGLVAQVRKMVPLVVPVTIHAIIGSEDIIDAMDLRAFGVGKRTWVDELHYRKIDRLIIVLSVIMLVLSISFSLFGFGKFWVPTELISRFPVL